MKESALGSKFFPFILDPFSEGAWRRGDPTGSHKKVVSLVYMVLNQTASAFSPLIIKTLLLLLLLLLLLSLLLSTFLAALLRSLCAYFVTVSLEKFLKLENIVDKGFTQAICTDNFLSENICCGYSLEA